MTDDDLRAALARDMDAAFEDVVLAYQRRLYAFALRYTACPSDAEEIVQDALVRAYRALQSYHAERVLALALRPWLFQIVVNVARNRARRGAVRLVPLDGGGSGGGSPFAEPEADPGERPDVLVERAEHRAELGALVAALPGRYRAAVILRHVNGLGYGEVAALLGQPVGTVKANVHRGLRLLRLSLREQAGALAQVT